MMAAKTVQCDVISPEAVLLSAPVDMVLVPGAAGYFAAMPDHAPLISALKPGVVDIYQQGQLSQRLYVSGGFIESAPDKVTLLAEEAVPFEQLDAATLNGLLDRVREEEKIASSDFARSTAQHQQRAIEAKLAALAGQFSHNG